MSVSEVSPGEWTRTNSGRGQALHILNTRHSIGVKMHIISLQETWKRPGRPLELILNVEIKVFLIKNYEASTSISVLLQSLDLDFALIDKVGFH